MSRRGKGEIPELLAPAGSIEALVAAVNAGADAVYLGGKWFSARGYAANFDEAQLEEAVRYAHSRKVSVYVAVNTLVLERELEDVARYLVWLYQLGVDAVLIQDTGLASLARKLVPDLPLHASTQMTIHNSEGAIWAYEMGFERVVLSREITLAEVLEIAEDVPGIGLEIFVHGALCYCYSGQCLLSSLIGGRSGNRGICAQPCRKPYSLVMGKRDKYGRYQELKGVELDGRYLMSTRDLCLYPHLEKIARLPIEAIKIEGRMRSPEYVAIVVSLYRRGLDAIADGAWSTSVEDLIDLELAYSRSFTDGHLLGAKKSELMGIERPAKRGVPLGRVISYDPKRSSVKVRLASDLVLERGDGIVFKRSGEEVGAEEIGTVLRETPEVRRGLISIRVPRPVPVGSRVELTRRSGLERKVREIVSSSRKVVPLDLRVTWEDGVPIIEGIAPAKGTRPIRVLMRGGFRMVEAKSRPITEGQIISQLRKTGSSPFFVRKIEIDYPGGLFSPISELNRLRREFLEWAEEAILSSYLPTAGEIDAAKERLEIWANKMASKAGAAKTSAVARAPGAVSGADSAPDISSKIGPFWREKLSISVYASSLAAVKGAAEGGCDRIYFEPPISFAEGCEGHPRASESISKGDQLSEISEALEICRSLGSELVWKWPKITRRRYLDYAIRALEDAINWGLSEMMVEGMGAALAARKVAPRIGLFGSVGLNVWNSLTVEHLSPTFQRLTLSPELSAEEMADLASRAKALKRCPELEIIAEGNIEAMVSEDCLPETALGDGEWSLASFLGLVDSRRRIFPLWIDGEERTHILNSVEMCLIDELPSVLEIGVDSIAIDARCRTGRYAREMAEIYQEAVRIAHLGGREEELEDLKKQARRMALGGITAGAFIRGRKEIWA